MRALLSIIAAAMLTPYAHAHAAEPSQPIVIAHRGGALLMPENTLPAFDNAIALGAEVLEFDMVMTADDQLVVQHDPTINASVPPSPVLAFHRAPSGR